MNTTDFQPGMMVHCKMTYRHFDGRVIRLAGHQLYDPGKCFIVLSFADGKEYRVSEFSMKRITSDGPEESVKEPMSDFGQSLFDMMSAIGQAQVMQQQLNQQEG